MSTRTLSSEDTEWLSRFLAGSGPRQPGNPHDVVQVNDNEDGLVVPVIAVKKQPDSAANSPNDLVYHSINSEDETDGGTYSRPPRRAVAGNSDAANAEEHHRRLLLLEDDQETNTNDGRRR